MRLSLHDCVFFSHLLGTGTEPLLRWVLDYFSGGDPQRKVATVGEALREARPVIVTDKLPIVLQHNGHSRTIVGCELGKGGAITLLTFDPAKYVYRTTYLPTLSHTSNAF